MKSTKEVKKGEGERRGMDEKKGELLPIKKVTTKTTKKSNNNNNNNNNNNHQKKTTLKNTKEVKKGEGK